MLVAFVAGTERGRKRGDYYFVMGTKLEALDASAACMSRLSVPSLPPSLHPLQFSACHTGCNARNSFYYLVPEHSRDSTARTCCSIYLEPVFRLDESSFQSTNSDQS